MHFWGLTLDVVSCNILVICVGLCVDFSVHIAHRFLATPGDRYHLYGYYHLDNNHHFKSTENWKYIDQDWASCA